MNWHAQKGHGWFVNFNPGPRAVILEWRLRCRGWWFWGWHPDQDGHIFRRRIGNLILDTYHVGEPRHA